MINGENIAEEFLELGGTEPNVVELKIDFIKNIADFFGEPLRSLSRTVVLKDLTDQVEVSFNLGDVPFVVFGVKGTGPCLNSAKADAAEKLLSFMEGYLPMESVELLRVRWSEATAQMVELVQVVEEFDKYLRKDEYSFLRQLHPFTASLSNKIRCKKFCNKLMPLVRDNSGIWPRKIMEIMPQTINGENITEELMVASGIEPNPFELKINFMQNVADVWGKQLNIISRTVFRAGADQLEVSFNIGFIPFIIFGVKGMGACLNSAKSFAAERLLSFMEGYLPKESVEMLRLRWSEATEQMVQLVQVLEEFDKYFNKDKYVSLRQLKPFRAARSDKIRFENLAQLVRDNIGIWPHKILETFPQTINGENIAEELTIAGGAEPNAFELKINFIQNVADIWGKQLNIISRTVLRTDRLPVRDGPDQVEVTFDLGDIPFIVLGVNGRGPCLRSAQADAAENLLSTMEGYLPIVSVELLRSQWSNAKEQIVQIIQVLEGFDKYLSTCEYATLRKMHPFTPSHWDEERGKRLRKSVRASIGQPIGTTESALTMSNDTSADQTALWRPISRAQSKLEGDVCSATAGIAAVALDSNRLDEWHALSRKKVFGGHATLSDWCLANSISQDYERLLLGVHYSGSENNDQDVQKFLLKCKEDCRLVDEEIWKHFHSNVQNAEVYAGKMHVRKTLLHQFKSVYPNQNIKLYPVGSTVNGCGSINSDLDLCLCVPDLGTEDQYTLITKNLLPLSRLKNLMYKKLKHIVKEAIVIPAKVPIIKAKLQPLCKNLALDINMNITSGIYNSHLFHYYSSLDIRFPCLTLLVKHWAVNSEICDPVAGTLNSYSLMLMMIHYLQCGVRPAVLPNLQYLLPEKFADKAPLNELELHKKIDGLPLRPVNVSTCVELLIGFFHYYANFNFETHGISIRHAKKIYIDVAAVSTSDKKALIYIEEPFDGHNDNNCARSVTKQTNVDRIKSAFVSTRSVFECGAPYLSSIGLKV